MATPISEYPELRMPLLRDVHVHLRRGNHVFVLATALSAIHSSDLLVMPNVDSPILTYEDAVVYRQEILDVCGEGPRPNLIMALKMTQDMTPEVINGIPDSPFKVVVKLYPTNHPDEVLVGPTSLHTLLWQGRGSVTTNSHGGVFNIRAQNIVDTLKHMEERRIPFCVHAAEAGAPNQEAEERFLAEHLPWLERMFPHLPIVIEHLSTKFGVELVETSGSNVRATITLHHLLLTHEDVVGGRVQPHHHCMPTPNTLEDMLALVRAAMSGNPKFMFGSDSAPHIVGTKECASGCAGVFTAPVLPSALAQLFHEKGCLDRLSFFASGAAGEFYDLPTQPGARELYLVPKPWEVPPQYTRGDQTLIPFLAGKTLAYTAIAT